MKKKSLFMIAMVLLFALLSGPVFGLTPMGSPVPNLMQGQFEAGMDYSYGKNAVKLDSSTNGDFSIDNMKTHYVGANLGYGVLENFQMNLRLGTISARGTEGGRSFNSSNSYAVGLGTKVKLFRAMNMQWGGLAQLLLARADGKARALGGSWTTQEELLEVQLALGPEYRLNEKAVIYGGPFIHIIDGNYTAKRRDNTAKRSYDLDQTGPFGGYIGTAINLAESVAFNLEYQHTASSDMFGMKLAYMF